MVSIKQLSFLRLKLNKSKEKSFVYRVLDEKEWSHFNRNKIFGVGIRNYAPEATKNINSKNSSVHPHQVHFEFLAELGLFGYFCFFYFIFQSLFFTIRSFIIKNDFYKFSGILFVFASLLPFIPTGSFFTTYGATLFWLNFAILAQNNKSK